MRTLVGILSLFVTSLAFGQANSPRGTIDPPLFTLLSIKKSDGTLTHRKVQGPSRQQMMNDSSVLRFIKSLNLVSTNTTLSVSESRSTHGRKRIVVQAQYRGKQILDRDIVINVNEHGHLSSVQANIPVFESADEPTMNEIAARQLLSDYILKKSGPSNLNIGAESKEGWLMTGTHLFPIVELEVLDPTRLRHFTARVDTLNGRVIGFDERTKD